MLEERFGSVPFRLIDPVTPARLIVSEPSLLPAAHSPAAGPEAVLVFAAMIASRKVHSPSPLFETSAVLLTVIVLPAAEAVSNANTRETVQTRMKSSARTRALM